MSNWYNELLTEEDRDVLRERYGSDTHNCRGRGCEAKADRMFRNVKYHPWSRVDFHGYWTGLYCDDCYENNYPYRRDDYTHGTRIADDGTPLE